MVKVVEKEGEGFKGTILKKLWYWSIPQVVGAYLPPHHHRLQQKPPPLPFPVHPQPLPSPLAPTSSPDDSAGRALRQLPLISPHRGPPPPNKQSNDVVDCDVDKENTRPISTPPPPPSRPVVVQCPAAAKDDTAGASLALQDTAPLISVVPKEDGSTASIPPPSSSYRRPDFNSDSLFDPDLLAAFRRAVMEHALASEELRRNINAPKEEEEAHEDDDDDDGGQEPPCKVPRTTDCGDEQHNDDDEEANDPLRGFELRCPPGGGGDAVVLYTTSLRGIRKTFEDCSSVRFLMQSLRVRFYERDVSMHLDYRDELWRVLGGRAVPPRLFVRGRYIGGADEVLCLHEQGRLLPLMRGMPEDPSGGVPCRGCGGARFVMCSKCSGSRKVYYHCYGGGGGSGGDGGDVLQAVNYRHSLPYRSESARFFRIAANQEKPDFPNSHENRIDSHRFPCESARFLRIKSYHGESDSPDSSDATNLDYRWCPHCNENGLVVCTLCCCPP